MANADDTVLNVQNQGESAEARTKSIKDIYGEEGLELGNEGEEVFAKRAAFDEKHNNASEISRLKGEDTDSHNLSRSTADSKAGNK